MSSNRVKVGIVGLGRWAKVLTRAAKTSTALEIVQGYQPLGRKPDRRSSRSSASRACPNSRRCSAIPTSRA